MTSMPTLEPVVVKTRPPLLKRLLLPGAGLLALIFAGVYAVHWWGVGRFLESTDDAYVGGDVTVIGPKVAGLHRRNSKWSDNQHVQGRRLADEDRRPRLRRCNLNKAEGAVAAEQALLANLDATEQLQQAVIGQAQSRHRCGRRGNRAFAG
jgi:membrane fusion protein (multidrug efflux system)